MKKVLFITTIGGFLTQFEMGQVRILKKMGYEIYYASDFDYNFYSYNEEDLDNEGVNICPISIKKMPTEVIYNCKAILEIRRLIKEYDIDVIHCNNPIGGVCGRLAAILVKSKPIVIYTAHGFHFFKGAPIKNWAIYYTTERILARCTDVLITINSEDYIRAKHFTLRKGGFVTKVNGMGVDNRRFRPMPEIKDEVKRELAIPDNAFHIVTAAEFNDNKNQQVVIQAIAELNRNDIYYTLCGRGSNEKKLRCMIHDYGLDNQVRVVGYRTDIERVLQTADVFAFPSIREGLGIAAIEALMCNVPVIASYNRGTREYIKDNHNGFFCVTKDVGSYKRVIEMLYNNRELMSELADNASDSVNKYSSKYVNRQFAHIYKKVDYVVHKDKNR